MTRILTIIALLFATPSISSANDLLLYGGSGQKEFLGCLVCNEFSAESVCNGFSRYGNEFGSTMWNEFSSPYGNEYSSSSPWNEYSSSNSVPVLVDRQGNFYGYFTINQYRSDAVEFAGQLNQIFRRNDGDVEKVRKTLCDILN
jgi:hypothetical protein